VDILQPCVTFNKINTYEWYKNRVKHIDKDYNPEDRAAAFQKALEWGDEIPIGVLYRNIRQTLESRINSAYHPHRVSMPDNREIEKLLKEFY
jgi:2-oxoglutarate ferredoxin oxidoreductase subunit beta